MSNTLLESLWARVTANIGDRIDQISGLLTEALAAASAAASSATNAKTSETNAKTSETNAASLLSTKANVVHTHSIEQVTGLSAALDGKASLVGGLIPTAQLPAVALTKPQVVPDRAGMLALTAQEGDVAVITAGVDKGTYMLGSGASTNFASWVALAAPTDAVTSVNGQTGVVQLAASDVGAAPSSHTHTSAQISDAVSTPTASMVMKRDSAGRAQVADPSAAADAATKKYVDDRIATRLASISSPGIVYGTDGSGNQAAHSVKNAAAEWSLAQRGTGGTVKVGDPIVASDAATKKYVDDGLASKADLMGGLVPTSQLPAVALTKPQVVPDRAGMLALTAQEGDVAVITAGTDKGTYMLGPGASTNFASWVALAAPTDAVTSVNGQTGVVNLSASNVGAAPSSHTHTSAQISDAVSTPTASMVMKRDSAGRAQVADPSAAADASTKNYVDTSIINAPKLHTWNGSGSWVAPANAGPNDLVLNTSTKEIFSVKVV